MLQQFFLFFGQVNRGFNHSLNVHIALTAPAHLGHALATQAVLLARLRTLKQRHRYTTTVQS
ncbi:uncharacterized protein METZ01_LOCUS307666, partial [marine metagenome]